MTPPCSLCHLNPAEPRRSVCTVCRREQRRVSAERIRVKRARPEPMTPEEYERQWEPVERVRRVEL